MKSYPLGVTAKQWVICESTRGNALFGKDFNVPAEIASQTKIMTAYVTLKLLEELDITEPKNFFIRVTKKAEKVQGTKAGL
jgi:D-alanyl-D-alanine carboxypeptidase